MQFAFTADDHTDPTQQQGLSALMCHEHSIPKGMSPPQPCTSMGTRPQQAILWVWHQELLGTSIPEDGKSIREHPMKAVRMVESLDVKSYTGQLRALLPVTSWGFWICDFKTLNPRQQTQSTPGKLPVMFCALVEALCSRIQLGLLPSIS